MEQAKVYFTTFKATAHENLLQKLHRLMKTAGWKSGVPAPELCKGCGGLCEGAWGKTISYRL